MLCGSSPLRIDGRWCREKGRIVGSMSVISFYGTEHPRLFAIERAAMDRSGRVLRALERVPPGEGPVWDIGAGDGVSAEKLGSEGRVVVPLEPAAAMIDRARALRWIRGDAEALPFAGAAFAGALSTWAYFFPSHHSIDTGIDELDRVVGSGGAIAIVANLGGDEFGALARYDVGEPSAPFLAQGFHLETIETARELLGLYFGDAGRDGARLSIAFRVGLYSRSSRGAGA